MSLIRERSDDETTQRWWSAVSLGTQVYIDYDLTGVVLKVGDRSLTA